MVKHDLCSGCGACYSVCPKQCITMEPDRLGFLYPIVNTEECVHCGACEKVCPALNKGNLEKKEPYAWGGHVKNEELRNASSSGGIFTLLAEDILRDNGVVFGAALSKDCTKVVHVKIESLRDLHRLRGSKYVQSSIGDTYLQANEALKNGKRVLFSGTPCQIDGLRLFLGKKYENLLTVEIICHGTPSPKLFEKYIIEMESKLGGPIKKVSFRDEVGGNSDYEN